MPPLVATASFLDCGTDVMILSIIVCIFLCQMSNTLLYEIAVFCTAKIRPGINTDQGKHIRP
jgi:hypothetical protein